MSAAMSAALPVSSSELDCPVLEGEGRLTFERSGSRTHVSQALARSPLRLVTPRNHGHAAWAYVTTFGGGLLDEDALSLRARVRQGASAFLSTQGPTRVFRG